MKSAVLKNFAFDSAPFFRLCEVYRFQNLVGLELQIKHVHGFGLYFVCLFALIE